MKDKINKTQLDVELAEDRGIVHRDYIAHCLRWNYALKFIDYNSRILDVGCGDGMLSQVLYVNKYKPKLYVGVDIRNTAVAKMSIRKANFPKVGIVIDFTKTSLLTILNSNVPPITPDFDVITCFEVVEHFEKKYLDFVLSSIAEVLSPEGVLLLSTPNYDGVHQAANHIQEFKADVLGAYLDKYFDVQDMIGTFASQKEILPVMSQEEVTVFEKLKKFLNTDMLSVMFASLHPYESRNILWVCRKKST